MDIGLYDLLNLAHVLFFVYWLGADLGVFYAARYSSNPELSLETRLVVADIMAFVDLFPRLSVPMIGVVGVHMSILSGAVTLGQGSLLLIWAVAVVWVGITFLQYFNRKRAINSQRLATFDWIWRSLVLVGAILAGVLSLLGMGITEDGSIAVKLIIYGAAIFVSFVLRWTFKPYRPALRRIVEGGDNVENSRTMQLALNTAQPVILGLWFLTVAAAAIGLWQPF